MSNSLGLHGLQQISLSFTISQSLLKLMSTESVMPSDHLILCCPFLFCLQSFPVSRSFPMSWLFHQVTKLLEISFSFSPSNEYSGLISFRIDQFDLLAVQGTVKSLLQHHSSKASILWSSVYTHIWLLAKLLTSLEKWCLCFLIRCFSAFLPRSKHLLISWLQSPSAVILEPKK